MLIQALGTFGIKPDIDLDVMQDAILGVGYVLGDARMLDRTRTSGRWNRSDRKVPGRH
jgi:hypothetical protein